MRRTSELADEFSRVGRTVRRGAFFAWAIIVAFVACLLLANGPHEARAQYVNPYSPTYQVAVSWTIAATGNTDAACIVGSASGATKVQRVTIDGTAAAAATAYLSLTMRTSLDTGGTSAAATIVPRDSADVAPHGSVITYSVQPTALGVGNPVDSRLVWFNTAGASAAPAPTVFDFTQGKPVSINGASQELCLSVAAAQNGFVPHMTVLFQGN